MGIVTLVLAIAPVVLQGLQTEGVPANVAKMIAIAIQSVEAFITAFQTQQAAGAQTSPGEAIAVLSALSAVITVLKQQTTLDPKALAMVGALESAVASGIAAYTQAGKVVDPTALKPIATV